MDIKSQVAALLKAHSDHIDELHKKLAAIPGINKERLAEVVTKYKASVAVFEDDAQGNPVVNG